MLNVKSIEIVGGVSFAQLQHDHCRWLTDGLYCGEPRRDERTSYCAHHHRIAYPHPNGGGAFSVGGFMRFRADAPIPAREATARLVEAPAVVLQQAINKDAYAEQARAIAETRKRIAESIAMTDRERIAAKESEIEAVAAKLRNETLEAERQEATMLARIRLQFKFVPTPQKVISQLPRIIQEVALKHGVSIADIKGPRRHALIVKARQEFFYRARHETAQSYPQISRFCGNRDHTSAMWSVRQHEARLRGEKIVRACHATKKVDASAPT